MKSAPLLAAAAVTILAARVVSAQAVPRVAPFDHARHEGLFPACSGCHAGAARSGEPMWPNADVCATCHDGTARSRVRWRTREPASNNLRFDHVVHARATTERQAQAGGREPPQCAACHNLPNAARMDVRLPVARVCLDCHGVQLAHQSAPDTACATCHLPLAEAGSLTAEDLGRFSAPPSHDAPGWGSPGGHGEAAKPSASPAGFPVGVSASCAVCHARALCTQCHVNAPENPVIQALPPDARVAALIEPGAYAIVAPPSHAADGFLAAHGRRAEAAPDACTTCHTQESCTTCHLVAPDVVKRLPSRGQDRAPGAATARAIPMSHRASFIERHGEAASAATSTCAACHVRSQCLDCHRPDAGAGPRGYHADGFLQLHPTEAYSRETSCSDCHNAGAFCVTCHAQSGLVAQGPLTRSGYHDGKQTFVAGHGVAARQSLESCVACHTENDCLFCHSAVTGRRFNPHGPGFDAERLRKRNPQMCTVCHGPAVPGS